MNEKKFQLVSKEQLKIFSWLYLHLIFLVSLTFVLTLIISKTPEINQYFYHKNEKGDEQLKMIFTILSYVLLFIIGFAYQRASCLGHIKIICRLVTLLPIAMSLHLLLFAKVLGDDLWILFGVAFGAITLTLIFPLFTRVNTSSNYKMLHKFLLILFVMGAVSNIFQISTVLFWIIWGGASIIFMVYAMVDAHMFRIHIENVGNQKEFELEFYHMLMNSFINMWGIFLIIDPVVKCMIKIFLKRRRRL